jgi:hypothetical protein
VNDNSNKYRSGIDVNEKEIALNPFLCLMRAKWRRRNGLRIATNTSNDYSFWNSTRAFFLMMIQENDKKFLIYAKIIAILWI